MIKFILKSVFRKVEVKINIAEDMSKIKLNTFSFAALKIPNQFIN